MRSRRASTPSSKSLLVPSSGAVRAVVAALVVVFAVGTAATASAKTTITGGNLGSRTWTPTNDPYVIKGDIKIPKQATLEIQAGVEVRVADTDGLQTGDDRKDVEWKIHGDLKLLGTKGKPVKIRGVLQQPESWESIDLLKTSNATIEYVEVRHAREAFDVSSTSKVTFRHATLRNNGTGISADGKRIEVIESAIHDNRDTGLFAHGDYATIRRSRFENNGRLGLHLDGKIKVVNAIVARNGDEGIEVQCDVPATATATKLIHSTTVYRNGDDGVLFDCNERSSQVRLSVLNTIVADNGPYGVRHDEYSYYGHTGEVRVEYSNVWGHTDNYESGVKQGMGNISSKPLFKNPPGDLHLGKTSLCIDAGSKKKAPKVDYEGAKRPEDGDGNGSADYDMGAYEFGASGVCGDGSVGPGETCDDGSDNGKYGHCNNKCSGLAAHCGDGTVNGPETCDDGNTTSGDGCSATCMTEGGDAGGMDAGDAGPDAGPMGDAGADTAAADDGGTTSGDGGSTTGEDDTGSSTGDSTADARGGARDVGGGYDGGGSGGATDDDSGGGGSGGCGCGAARSVPVGGLLFVVTCLVGLLVRRRRRPR